MKKRPEINEPVIMLDRVAVRYSSRGKVGWSFVLNGSLAVDSEGNRPLVKQAKIVFDAMRETFRGTSRRDDGLAELLEVLRKNPGD